jgi:hypothetical protein
MFPRLSVRPRAAALLILLAAAACADAEDTGAAKDTRATRSAAVAVVGVRPGVTQEEFTAMPDSARIGGTEAAGGFDAGSGVAVEVEVRLQGFAGDSVPLAYTLHDARNKVPFVSQTVPVAADAEVFRRRGHVWLPVPSPGTYYVQVAVNDSTGRSTDGPRTQDFTV